MATLKQVAGSELEKALRANPQFVAAKMQVAEQVAREARAAAPVAEQAFSGKKATIDRPGQYRDGIHARRLSDGRVIVASDDYKSAWIEFGTEGDSPTPAFAVLRNAARTAGLKFRGKRKRR